MVNFLEVFHNSGELLSILRRLPVQVVQAEKHVIDVAKKGLCESILTS